MRGRNVATPLGGCELSDHSATWWHLTLWTGALCVSTGEGVITDMRLYRCHHEQKAKCALLMKAYPFLRRGLLQCHSEYGEALLTASDFLNQQPGFGDKLIRSVGRKEERNARACWAAVLKSWMRFWGWDPFCIAKALEVPLGLKYLYSSYLKAYFLTDQWRESLWRPAGVVVRQGGFPLANLERHLPLSVAHVGMELTQLLYRNC